MGSPTKRTSNSTSSYWLAVVGRIQVGVVGNVWTRRVAAAAVALVFTDIIRKGVRKKAQLLIAGGCVASARFFWARLGYTVDSTCVCRARRLGSAGLLTGSATALLAGLAGNCQGAIVLACVFDTGLLAASCHAGAIVLACARFSRRLRLLPTLLGRKANPGAVRVFRTQGLAVDNPKETYI